MEKSEDIKKPRGEHAGRRHVGDARRRQVVVLAAARAVEFVNGNMVDRGRRHVVRHQQLHRRRRRVPHGPRLGARLGEFVPAVAHDRD